MQKDDSVSKIQRLFAQGRYDVMDKISEYNLTDDTVKKFRPLLQKVSQCDTYMLLIYLAKQQLHINKIMPQELIFFAVENNLLEKIPTVEEIHDELNCATQYLISHPTGNDYEFSLSDLGLSHVQKVIDSDGKHQHPFYPQTV